MLYPKSHEKFSQELFENPSSEYRGTPFWAWNCLVREDQLEFESEIFRQMGMGGAHIHCRVGMNVPYLGERFMELVEYARRKFEEKGMLTWLYDEDKWPSGYGGGHVTRDHDYRMRFLVISPEKVENGPIKDGGRNSSTGQIKRSSERVYLGSYLVKLNEQGLLEDYAYYKNGEEAPDDCAGYEHWYVYREVSGDNVWFNNEAYADTLNPKAIRRFLDVTHERYAEKVGKYFGTQIPAIFTDEPQFAHKGKLGKVKDRDTIFLPFTDDFEESYKAAYQMDFLPDLPQLFWESAKDRVSRIRYQYHDHVAERFASAFADQIGAWCEDHGLYLTGHMMEEPTLTSQTAALGEAMRSYRSFGIPGIDMLCDWRELNTAKQTQSAVHQFGREGMLSEIYGVTGWDFDFRKHKLAGDWQAALGVTVRVHHLTWMSMEGEAKRDYPACIGYQSPWYREYHRIEDHFSRLNTVLTRGVPDVKIGVIHPIESFWLLWGSDETTGTDRKEREECFTNLTNWLLFGRLDFDFIAESLLETLTPDADSQNKAGFQVGKMNYDVILVPNCLTLRQNTLDRLKKFAALGGKIVFVGDAPEYIDAKPSQEGKALAAKSLQIPFLQTAVLNALEPFRSLDIRDHRGQLAENLIYQMREEQDEKWLFIAHVNRPEDPDATDGRTLTFRMNGSYEVTMMDTESGEITSVEVQRVGGKTEWNVVSYPYDSYLYKLTPTDAPAVISSQAQKEEYHPISRLRLPSSLPVTLEEPNVLVLDLAEYALDDGAWMEKEEILRLDNRLRDLCGYPRREDAYAQPWTYGQLSYEHKVHLRYTVCSEVEVEKAQLAMEHAPITQATWNGQKLEQTITGWYVDREIGKIDLGRIEKGVNTLEITIPYHANVNLESLYLLGDFGVKVSGYETCITEPVRKLTFSDYSRQGLAFYGGNLTYEMELSLEKCQDVKIQFTKFRCPVMAVTLDGREECIYKSPYCAEFHQVPAGDHKVQVKVFGNRVNTFGCFHNCVDSYSWIGPNAWRTEGEQWSYEYALKPSGILAGPQIFVKD